MEGNMSILDLPNVILLEIFEFLSYDEVAKNRIICRRFDQIAQQVLNRGFNKVINQHSLIFKRIKSLLPRRESERRNHCLARHTDILTSIETRISMLSMTYSKYMDLDLCCFIPGRVLDETFRVLKLISKTNRPIRAHETLQELRDISSMAIEHFDEKIANTLKRGLVVSTGYYSDSRRFAAASLGILPMGTSSIMGNSSNGTSNAAALSSSAALSIFGSNTYLLAPLARSLGLIPDRSTGNTPRAILNDKEPVQPSIPSTSSGGSHVGACPEARATSMYYKQLEAEFKKGIVKIHRMQQIQNLQNKRVQQILSYVTELSLQLKKQVDYLHDRNSKMSANVEDINDGPPATTGNIENNPKCAKNESDNKIEDEVLLPSTSSSSLAAKTSDKKSKNRRRTRAVQKSSARSVNPDDNSESQPKNPKLE